MERARAGRVLARLAVVLLSIVAPLQHGLAQTAGLQAPGGDPGLESMKLGPRSRPVSPKLFTRLTAAQTGVDLVHAFPPTGSAELLQDQGAAAGICIGDFDQDGLPDLFIADYDRGNRLYRNQGGFRFEDVTAGAGVAAPGPWCAGVCAVDVDNDGDLDISACVFNGPNLIFLNDGHGVFRERARELGLDFKGASVMTAFGDYDLDGRLDAYLVTHRLSIGPEQRLPRNAQESLSRGVIQRGRDRGMAITPEFRDLFGLTDKGGGRAELFIAGQADRLFRNLGPAGFTNATAAAGIAGHDIGLSAAWWDYDDDGWPDLYVSNDYKGPDRLYHNRGDGTFEEVTREALPHVPWSSMGADCADVNNDGRIDFLATEMAGSTHRRRQMILDDLRERWFLQVADPPQYPRNALYLATGTGRVMEVAQLAGVARTDWTWSPKFADFDNDGWVDLFIANGMSRDYLNADLLSRMRERGAPGWRDRPLLREANLAFRNLGDLRFVPVGPPWGLDQVSASFGAAVADLDRDGDLDLVVSSLEEPVAIYRNDESAGHGVLIRLKGTRSNRWGLQAKITLEAGANVQTRCPDLTSGFMSANEPLVHVGVGENGRIRRLTVDWPSGHTQSFDDLEVDRLYTVIEPDSPSPRRAAPKPPTPLLRQVAAPAGLRHRESHYDDFQREPLLPWKLSQAGPGLALADVNGDGTEDLFLSGAAGDAGSLVLREAPGKGFKLHPQRAFEADKESEDLGAVFFDADADGDQDLYVASGGGEFGPGDARLRDRLYVNDGHGNFTPAPDGVLPDLRDAGAVVAAADVDRDGDLDLFVGSRLVPGGYPLPADSRLLLNDPAHESDPERGLQSAGSHAGQGTSLRAEARAPDRFMATEQVQEEQDAAQEPQPGRAGTPLPAALGAPGTARPTRTALPVAPVRFRDATATLAPALRQTGLVTSAIWSDADDDGGIDLLVTHEWGPVKFFRNQQGRLVDHTREAGLAEWTGLWNGIAAGDPDEDGDMDYVVTNLGLNTRYTASRERPAVLFRGDFDGSGQAHLIEATFDGDTLFPLRSLNALTEAIPSLAARFSTVREFSEASLEQVFSAARLQAAPRFTANTLESGLLRNDGKARFTFEPLPRLAQVAPAFGVGVVDLDGDGHEDVVLAHNSFSPQPETGRMDGGLGLVLRGRGDGTFLPWWPDASGFSVRGDAKALAVADLNLDGRPDLLVGMNHGELLAFENAAPGDPRWIEVELRGRPGNLAGVGARVTMVSAAGRRRVAEVYAGSGYLTQPGSRLYFARNEGTPPARVEVRWPGGRVSTLSPAPDRGVIVIRE